jgi:hypothetical protein
VLATGPLSYRVFTVGRSGAGEQTGVSSPIAVPRASEKSLPRKSRLPSMRPNDRAITGEVDAGKLSDEILREVRKGLS